MATASLIPAVLEAARKAIDSLLARGDNSRFAFQRAEARSDLEYRRRAHSCKNDARGRKTLREALRAGNARAVVRPRQIRGHVRRAKPKVSSAFVRRALRRGDLAAGDRAPPREPGGHGDRRRPDHEPVAARNQIEGAIVMGIGMALLEATIIRLRPVRRSKAASRTTWSRPTPMSPHLDVHFLEYPNTDFNEYGARGVGEIGLPGSRRRSPTPCTTRRACAFASCRSRSSSYSFDFDRAAFYFIPDELRLDSSQKTSNGCPSRRFRRRRGSQFWSETSRRSPDRMSFASKVPGGIKLMPHVHSEDRIYTVISGIFYVGRGTTFDASALTAYAAGSVVVLPGGTAHFHWAQSGEYVSQVNWGWARSGGSTTSTPTTTREINRASSC